MRLTDEVRQRQPRVECPAFLAFLRRKPCVACGAPAPSQAAHVRFSDAATGHVNPGVGAKPDDRRAVPLCASCHLDAPDSQHRIGDERKFWARVGKNPDEVAERLWGQFVRRCARSPEKRKAVASRARRILRKRKPMMENGVEADLIVRKLPGLPFETRKPNRAKDPELYRYRWGQGRQIKNSKRWPKGRKLRSAR